MVFNRNGSHQSVVTVLVRGEEKRYKREVNKASCFSELNYSCFRRMQNNKGEVK